MAPVDWDESEHPRHPRGSSRGGEFRDRAPSWAQLTSGIVGQASGTKQWQRGEWFDSGYRGPREWKDQATQSMAHALVAEGFELDDALKTARIETASLPMPQRVIVNGPHRLAIFQTDPFETEIDDILGLVDDLLEDNSPEDPLTLAIVSPGLMALGPDAFGETIRGTGHIRLASRAMTNDIVPPPMGPGSMMPSWDGTPTWRYVLVHEWAHAIDDDRDADRRKRTMMELYRDDLSDYGISQPNEAYAEAFAEFILDPDTENPAAKAYARQFGWKPLRGDHG